MLQKRRIRLKSGRVGRTVARSLDATPSIATRPRGGRLDRYGEARTTQRSNPGLGFEDPVRGPKGLLVLLVLAGCVGYDQDDEGGARPSLPGTSSPAATAPPTETRSEWTTKADLPEARGEIACASLGERIYVFGGYAAGRTPSPRIDIYDASKDQWSQGADAPVGLHHAQIVAYGNELYVPGGYTTSNFQGTNLFLKYNPSGNAWTVLPLLPRVRGAHAAVVAGDDLYLVGGRAASPGDVYRSVDIYNFTTGQWRTGPEMSVAREHIAAGVAAGQIVAFGGRPGTMNLTESMVAGGNAWTVRPSMPTARSGIAVAAWGQELVVFGGEMPGVFGQAEGYHVTTHEWRSHPPMPHPRHGLCAAPLDDGLHVIGGGDQQGFSLTQHHEVLRIPSE